MIYFTADTHFYHSNVIELEKRPFQTVEEMDEALIQNWNSKVGPEDEVYILGDLTLKGPSAANEVLARLQGRKYLIRGNHDRYVDRKSFRREHFVWVRDYFELEYRGQYYVLCHYPFQSWNGMRHGSFQLHGHIHSKYSYNHGNRVRGVRQLDVGVDAQGMTPVSVEELLAFWEEEHHQNDGHWGRVKPWEIRLEMTCPSCPEQYDAFDRDGNQIGYLRLRGGSFRVDCPDCGGTTVYEADPAGWFEFEDGEREWFLEKAKRAIAEYWRTAEGGASGAGTDGRDI